MKKQNSIFVLLILQQVEEEGAKAHPGAKVLSDFLITLSVNCLQSLKFWTHGNTVLVPAMFERAVMTAEKEIS